MSMVNQRNDLDMVTHAINAYFVYAACTEAGYVKVGISGKPAERIFSVHSGSPSPVRAAQWVWIGSASMARKIESQVKKQWSQRHTRGEWYKFDYSKPEDKRDFHDTLNAIIEVVTKKPPEWTRLNPNGVDTLLKEQVEQLQVRRNNPKPRPFWK